MQITIASIDPKEKLTFVTTSDGKKLRCWNDKAGKWGLERGASYEIETENTDYGTHITKAKRTAGPTVAQSASAPASSTPFRTPEMFFVEAILGHYIDAGQCAPNDLIRYINAIRFAWNRTLGETGPFVSGGGPIPMSEAAE